MNTRRAFLRAIPFLPGAVVATATAPPKPKPQQMVVEVKLDAEKFAREFREEIFRQSREAILNGTSVARNNVVTAPRGILHA